ncbi:DNA cytosine methyltransferase [uncultured Victivallis sp.]|uniref:DNA cytosine methyltransferase n=1 Tax=uncultured Victivallis sp. TaxID=354118 RepID=UPI0025FC09E4|nr:DNA cytosine methyltransferase [uncultured Victivallis sp.]
MSFRFVDLFCGGGGSITGAVNALRAAGEKYEGRGFNHWETAIRTIQANHPEIVPDFARACAPIQSVLPDEVFDVDPERIDVLWASPSCTHHSIAAGGKPRSNQLRSQPEYLLPFLRLTKCRRMFVENVRELLDWGPLLDKDTVFHGKKYRAGSPDPRRKGAFFNLWLREIRASGYDVDLQLMNSADYGAATSRERLIVQAVRKSSGERIVWPEPTHTKEPGLLSGSYLPWRPAADVINWTIPGKSIFDREKPLCKNTLRRIEAGIRKYWGAWAEPFLIVLRGTSEHAINSTAIPLSAPLPTLTAGGEHVALIRPLFIPQHGGGTVKPVTNPLLTVATTGSIGMVEPFIVEYYGQGGAVPLDIPLHTVTTKDRFGIIRGRIFTAPDGRMYQLDITHRMLTAGELAAAMSFPRDYVFCGGDTAAKKQIGNAVPPLLAEALYRAVLAA